MSVRSRAFGTTAAIAAAMAVGLPSANAALTVSQATRPSSATYGAELDPAADEPFAITGIRVLDDGRLELSFNGVREDLDKDARDALYPVYRAETIGGTESPVAGTTKIDVDGGVKRTVWTSNAPIDETQGFYRVKVESNCQQ